MKTRIFKIESLDAGLAQLEEAGAILRKGGLVAFPTETVYGLGGNALDASASARIYAAKGRPQDNPLIVHIADMAQLDTLCHDIPDAARALADAYWPGPLTMILPKNDCIPDATTAGLDTAGIRMPAHPAARALIRCARVPIAAPSANLSGKPSTTSFAHVLRDMDGRIDAIIDGGDSEVGVESTVIEFDSGRARILRPGYITLEDIEAVLGPGMCLVAPGVREHVPDGERVRSPGMKYRHYAPAAPVLAICGESRDVAREMRRRARGHAGCAAIICNEYADSLPCETIACGPDGDPAAQAHRLFDALRRLDRPDVSFILAQCPDERGVGLAVANRLKRAAAFHVIQARRTYVLGLTGPTGAGKSAAGACLASLGAEILDCDALYHEMLQTDAPMLCALHDAFPEAFPGGRFDRRTLGRLVFSNPDALARLNAAVLPFVSGRVESEIARADAQGAALFVLDAPTLFESGTDALCDFTLGILAPAPARIARIAARDGLDEAYARLRVEGGQDDAYYLDRCDAVIQNDGDFEKTRTQVEDIVNRINLRR